MRNSRGAQLSDNFRSQPEIRPLMRSINAWMTFDVLLTALVAILVCSSPTFLDLARNPLSLIVAIIAELVLLWVVGGTISRRSAGIAMLVFLVYAALNVFTLSLVFIGVDIGTLMMAFLTTPATCAAMALIPLTTHIE